jgi:hypothetical protein
MVIDTLERAQRAEITVVTRTLDVAPARPENQESRYACCENQDERAVYRPILTGT